MRTPHKHCNAMKAFADGWKIEYYNKVDQDWILIDYPTWLNHDSYRIVPDDDNWLPWYGGECPLPANTIVDWKYDSSKLMCETQRADNINWSDNILYRIVKEKPKTKVMRWQFYYWIYNVNVPHSSLGWFKDETEAKEWLGNVNIKRIEPGMEFDE